MASRPLYGASLVLLTLLTIAPAASADGDFTPVYHPTMTVRPAVGEIKIDGALDDAGWRGAGIADNFAEHTPGDQTRPPVDTKALLTYDSEYLYAAFVCYDDPSTIRATLCERDKSLGPDDDVALLLDTYGDASRAYELFVNPYGVQSDALYSKNGGEDITYDLIWKSAAMITDSGYQVEMAIPFASLRFPNSEQQTWKVDFWRNHPRDTRRQYSWAAYDRSDPCWPCKWGTVTGIANVQPGGGIELMPSVIAYQSGLLHGAGSIDEPFDFDNKDPDGEMSLGAKYSITSDIMAEATYNPDFSQIEADAAQIDVNSTFALFYSERRPFFQEGSDLFKTIFDAVYTRSINDPEFAGKMTARLNRASLAYMVARDENSPMILPSEESSRYLSAGRSTSNIVRGRYAFGEDSRVGFLATDRRFDGGGSGTLLSADMDLNFAKAYRLEWQAIGSYTQEPDDTTLTHDPNDSTFSSSRFDDGRHTIGFDGESFWGHALYLGVSREASNSYFDVSYLERSPTYRAANGFQPRNNQRSGRFYAQYVFRFDEGLIQTIVPSASGGRQWNFSGQEKMTDGSLDVEFAFRFAQLSTHSCYQRESERLGGIWFEDIWLIHTCLNSRPASLFSCGGSINYGHQIARHDLVMGKETSLSAWLDLKPVGQLLVETSFNYLKSDRLDTGAELFEGYIVRSRAGYQFTRELSLRLVVQYDDFYDTWDVDPLLSYRLNPFSALYLGSTYDFCKYTGLGHDECGVDTRLSARQFFFKLQYLFQV